MERAVRTSMLLRGVRPDLDELAQVRASPDALDGLVDGWMEGDAFAATIRDLHAEELLLRADTEEQIPSYGPLEGYDTWTVHTSVTDEPLRLVEWVVMHDRPYSEIFTADYMVTDDVVARVYGLEYDPDGATWQQSEWVDGRPMAGILTSSELWRRHRSAGSNFHRARAELLARTFLCESFASRDAIIEGGVDLSDEFAVAHAVSTNTSCIGCHQALDPLAALFWGFRHQLEARAIQLSYADDCVYDPDNVVVGAGPMGALPPDSWTIRDSCYPLRFYVQNLEDEWEDWELRPPGYFGVPAERLDDLGELVAADPRMATCTVRRFWSWFAQQPREDLDDATLYPLAERFVASGYDTKALVKDIVTHERFAIASTTSTDPWQQPVGLLKVRSEQLDTLVRDLTGFTWWGAPPSQGCAPACWGSVNLLRSDLYGFRVMSGGIDGVEVTTPSHTPTPTLPLVLARLGAEAAADLVARDFGAPVHERRLLRLVEPWTTDEPALRAQLVELHERFFGEATPDAVDATYRLWSRAHALSGAPDRAWTLTLSAMLQDPAMVFY